MTLQSFAGTGFGNTDYKSLISRGLSNTRACQRWENVQALVFDECCFIHGDYFESLEQIAREVRGVNNWGGIQLVVGGDFFQYPPIMEKKSKAEKKFAFKADCWNASFNLQMELTKIFGLSDVHLVKLMQGIQRRKCDPDDLKLLEKCCSRPEEDPSAVQLFPSIRVVNAVNKAHSSGLGNNIFVYTASNSGEKPWKRQLKLGIAPDLLELCIGARVMLCKNLDFSSKLVNGAAGTI